MAKILIVDDEKNIRLLYREEFQDLGHEVIEAKDGFELIEKIEAQRPDLIILDIKMAEYNGLDLLQQIRERFIDLPVILSSAYGTYKGEYKAMSADSFVVKSADLSALKKRVRQVLQTRIPSSGPS